MDPQPDPFTYTPLDSDTGSFRLLRLKKGSGQRLEGELIHGTIEEKDGLYEAISYTWGASAIQDFIYINGKPLGITFNLSLVLRDLRLPDADRILWNDATCIYQKDLVEQGHQVRQMGKIYKGARAVLFCLARPTELTDFLLDTLNSFREEVVIEYNENKIRTEEQATANEYGLETPLQLLWDNFIASFENKHYMCAERLALAFEQITLENWFKRVWIVQEVFNAREGFVYCGRKWTPATLFSHCGNFIANRSNILPHAAKPLLDMMAAPASKDGNTLEGHNSLHELIITFSLSRASHAYDRIYALLGMATDTGGTGHLVPDYTISTMAVIKHTIQHFCEVSETFPTEPPINSISQFIETLCCPGDSTLLLWAAQCEHEPLVRYMLQHGADPTKAPRNYYSEKIPLVEASLMGNAPIIRLMLAADGCDPDIKDGSGYTALHHATDKGHVAVVNLLLGTGRIDVNRTVSYSTGLTNAARHGYEAIARLLLDTERIEVDTRFEALHEAVRKGDESMVELLLGTDKDYQGSKPYDFSALLLTAASRGHLAIVKRMLDTRKVNVNFRDNLGQTPLLHAAAYNHQAVFELLLGADGIDIDSRDSQNWTPLHRAVERGADNIVRLLLATGQVEVDLRNKRNGGTPFHTAAKHGHVEIMKMLYKTGDVDVNLRDTRDGGGPLFWAAAGGFSDAVRMLIDTGKVDINAKTDYNITPYMQASMNDRDEVLEILLATGQVDLDAWDDEIPDKRPYGIDGNPLRTAEEILGAKIVIYRNFD